MNIPSIPVEKLLNDELHDIDPAWRQFFDQLINALQVNAGLEGLVAPSQSASNTTIIQANQNQNGSYSCQGGTILYQPIASNDAMIPDLLVVAILDPITRIPAFFSVNLTPL